MSGGKVWLPVGVISVFVVSVTAIVVLAVRHPEVGDPLSFSLPLMTAFGAFVLSGAVLVARRHRNPLGWLLLTVGGLPVVSAPLERAASVALEAGRPLGAHEVVGMWLNSWYWIPMLVAALIVLPSVFPTGRFLSRRWAWAQAPPIAAAVVLGLSGMFGPQLHAQATDRVIANPLALSLAPGEESLLMGLAFPIIEAGLLVSLASVAVRYRRAGSDERAQLRWFLWATCLLPLIVVAEQLEHTLGPLFSEVVLGLVLTGLPVAITIAVLRYRLYDIDRLVSRTVSYGAVTAVLLGTYAGVVLAAQAVLGPADAPDVVIAGATLLVAALFGPVRSRVQSVVDRRFDRHAYDAVRVVAAFGERTRDQVQLHELAHVLTATVDRSVGPEMVALWLPDPVGDA